jgi:hypothetical protein
VSGDSIYRVHLSRFHLKTESPKCGNVGQWIIQSKSRLRLTVGQSVRMYWCRGPYGSHDQMFVTVRRLLSCICGAPSLRSGLQLNVRSQSQSYFTTDGQSARLTWCQALIWDSRSIFLLLALIIFRELRVCWRGAPSLTRSRVCSFRLLLEIASAVSVESRFLPFIVRKREREEKRKLGGGSERHYFVGGIENTISSV